MIQVPLIDLKAQYRTIQDGVGKSISEVLEATDPSSDANARAFEAEFAAYCRTRHAVGVASGTDALYLALRACGIGAGDEVITVANGFFETVAAILLLKAVPVFVDVDPETYTLDPSRLGVAIGQRTRAIVAVHLYGHVADMEAIISMASRHGLVVVEDASQSPGAEDRGRRAGSMGDAAAFSFHSQGNLSAYGDAGAVTTNSRAIAEQVRSLSDYGSIRAEERRDWGINSRLSELQAGVLRVKLRYLDRWNRRRQLHAQTYGRLLEEIDIVRPVARRGSSHVYHRYVIQAEGRDLIRDALGHRGIATGIHYPVPLHKHLAGLQDARVAHELTVTEALSRRVLSLPMYPELSPHQITHVANCLREHVAVVQADSRTH